MHRIYVCLCVSTCRLCMPNRDHGVYVCVCVHTKRFCFMLHTRCTIYRYYTGIICSNKPQLGICCVFFSCGLGSPDVMWRHSGHGDSDDTAGLQVRALCVRVCMCVRLTSPCRGGGCVNGCAPITSEEDYKCSPGARFRGRSLKKWHTYYHARRALEPLGL